MGSVATLESTVPPAAAGEPEVIAIGADGGAVAALGISMAILGVIHLAGEVVEYVGAWQWALRSGAIASRGLGWFLGKNPPAYLLINAWPMALGLALRRTRWRDLVQAGALTFLVLSVGGLLSAVADWSQAATPSMTIGSFRLPKSDWRRLPAPVMAMGLVGVAQLVLELATAAWAFTLARRRDGTGPIADRSDAARRSRLGRVALCFSAGFLVLTIRLPAWSAYLELIGRSRWVREFILRDDLARIRTSRAPAPPDSAWALQARELYKEAEQAWRAGNYEESAERYVQLTAMIDTMPTATMTEGERRLAAQGLNNRAWLLATCPVTGLRNHEEAVALARRALDLEPNDYLIWNTLGVAYFRLGAWDDALSALYRSMELHDEGNSFDWFFLAMIHHRLGHKERAREWYDMAVRYARADAPGNEELYRFEVEAADTLGLPKPPKLAPAPDRRMGPHSFGLPPIPGRRSRLGPRGGRGDGAMEPASPPYFPGGRRRTFE